MQSLSIIKQTMYQGDVLKATAVDEMLVVVVGCFMSEKHASVSQRWICSDNCTCCHTEAKDAEPTCYLIQA